MIICSDNIDYVSTYFEYPTFKKNHGKLVYEILRELKKEIKPNASAVTGDLGGG